NGEVWGRGAIDMLNLTASMAVATKELARSGYRPKGTLTYFAVADEEAGGDHGAGWVTDHEYDAVRSDYVLTESGGVQMVGVDANLREALGPDLAGAVDVSVLFSGPATASPMATPMWDAIGRVAGKMRPGTGLVPRMTAGGTDARFFRERGAVAYGFGLFST